MHNDLSKLNTFLIFPTALVCSTVYLWLLISVSFNSFSIFTSQKQTDTAVMNKHIKLCSCRAFAAIAGLNRRVDLTVRPRKRHAGRRSRRVVPTAVRDSIKQREPICLRWHSLKEPRTQQRRHSLHHAGTSSANFTSTHLKTSPKLSLVLKKRQLSG